MSIDKIEIWKSPQHQNKTITISEIPIGRFVDNLTPSIFKGLKISLGLISGGNNSADMIELRGDISQFATSGFLETEFSQTNDGHNLLQCSTSRANSILNFGTPDGQNFSVLIFRKKYN